MSPPVEEAAARLPPLSSATAPTVPAEWSRTGVAPAASTSANGSAQLTGGLA